MGREFPGGVEGSTGEWELQSRNHCGLRSKNKAAFLLLSRRGQVPRYRLIEVKEFQLNEAGRSQQTGAHHVQGLEHTHSPWHI